MRLRFSQSLYLSTTLGVVYGVALRLLMDVSVPLRDGPALIQGLVSISFFGLVPMVIGFITIALGSGDATNSLKRAIFAPWLAIAFFLLTSVILLLEGSICVVLALPGFLLLSSVGGLIAWWIIRQRLPQTGALSTVLILPVLVSPIEGSIPPESRVNTVESRIEITAPTSEVWAQITDVGLISKDELSFGLTRLMGMPQPLEARMEATESGWVRNTRWEQGIEFRELITDSREGEYLDWNFDFPPSAIPDGVLDEHVRIGGQYFELLQGGYRLEPDQDGSTVLTLRTTYRVTARPALYSRYWAKLVMSDFHRMILNLIRDRSEEA